VFYGDVSRPEVLQSFNVGNAKMIVTAMSDKATTNKAVETLKRLYPHIPILARASDAKHQKKLVNSLGISAMTPKLPLVRGPNPL
jgi:voltage-gated potassium channel Kch